MTPATEETGIVPIGGFDVAYVVIRSAKRKRTLAFKMEGDKTLRIFAPRRARLADLLSAAQGNDAWVIRKLTEQKVNPVFSFNPGDTLPYLGHACTLFLTRNPGTSSCVLRQRQIIVNVPDLTLSEAGTQAEVKFELQLALKKRARRLFRQRLDLWAARLGVQYAKMIVADAERRWGSCTVDNVIRLNWRLLTAPLPVVDYVVAHELCHVRNKDHSPRFWAQLESVMPDWKPRRKTLRRLESRLGM